MKKKMIKALKSSFQNVVRLQNKNVSVSAADFHALYLAYLEACGRKKEAFKHVLKLIDENKSADTVNNNNENNNNYNNYNNNDNNNNNNNNNNTSSDKSRGSDADDDDTMDQIGNHNNPNDSTNHNHIKNIENSYKLKNNEFQNLFLCYFCRFHKKTQTRRILTAALLFLKNDCGSLHSVELGESFFSHLNFFFHFFKKKNKWRKLFFFFFFYHTEVSVKVKLVPYSFFLFVIYHY